MLSQFVFCFFYFLSLSKTSCTVWLLSLSPSPWSNMSQRPHCPVATAPPGLLLQCPPPSCRCGPLEQCLDSAAPEPPARYRSCSRNLRMKSEWEVKKKCEEEKKLTTQSRGHQCLRRFPRFFLTFVRVVVADVFDGVPHHLLVVYIGPRCDFSTEQHHAGLAHRLCEENSQTMLSGDLWKPTLHPQVVASACWARSLLSVVNIELKTHHLYDAVREQVWRWHKHPPVSVRTTGHFGIWILLQVSVQDSITDLVTDLICGEASGREFRAKTDKRNSVGF